MRIATRRFADCFRFWRSLLSAGIALVVGWLVLTSSPTPRATLDCPLPFPGKVHEFNEYVLSPCGDQIAVLVTGYTNSRREKPVGTVLQWTDLRHGWTVYIKPVHPGAGFRNIALTPARQLVWLEAVGAESRQADRASVSLMRLDRPEATPACIRHWPGAFWPQAALDLRKNRGCDRFRLAPDGQTVAIFSCRQNREALLELWDTQTGTKRWTCPLGERYTSGLLSHDDVPGRLTVRGLLFPGRHGKVLEDPFLIIDTTAGQLLRTVTIDPGSPVSDYSAAKTTLLAHDRHRKVLVEINLATAAVSSERPVPTDGDEDAGMPFKLWQFGPEGTDTHLAYVGSWHSECSGSSGALRLYEGATGRLLRKCDDLEGDTLSPTRRYLAHRTDGPTGPLADFLSAHPRLKESLEKAGLHPDLGPADLPHAVIERVVDGKRVLRCRMGSARRSDATPGLAKLFYFLFTRDDNHVILATDTELPDHVRFTLWNLPPAGDWWFAGCTALITWCGLTTLLNVPRLFLRHQQASQKRERLERC